MRCEEAAMIRLPGKSPKPAADLSFRVKMTSGRWMRKGGGSKLKVAGFLVWEMAQPGTTGYLALEWMQEGPRTEATGGVLIRSLKAKWKFRLEKMRFNGS